MVTCAGHTPNRPQKWGRLAPRFCGRKLSSLTNQSNWRKQRAQRIKIPARSHARAPARAFHCQREAAFYPHVGTRRTSEKRASGQRRASLTPISMRIREKRENAQFADLRARLYALRLDVNGGSKLFWLRWLRQCWLAWLAICVNQRAQLLLATNLN